MESVGTRLTHSAHTYMEAKIHLHKIGQPKESLVEV